MRKSPDDGCSPPVDPVDVFCLHCGSVYSSDAMFHDGKRWRCGIGSCNGIGFGIDVHDVSEPGVKELIRLCQGDEGREAEPEKPMRLLNPAPDVCTIYGWSRHPIVYDWSRWPFPFTRRAVVVGRIWYPPNFIPCGASYVHGPSLAR